MATNFVQISRRLLTPRIPELGQIKIGGKGELRKSRGGKEFRLPVKYDHFVVTTRRRDEKTDNLVRDAAIHQVIGERPTELDVRLMWDMPEANFQYFLAAYDGRRRRCIGNGETAEDVEHGQILCPCPWLKQYAGVAYPGPQRQIGRGAPVCKPHGRLSVILEAAKTFGGFYTFRTTSWESISSIASQLQLYQEQFRYLAGLPLKLVIYPTTDQYEEDGNLKTSTSYKVALVLRGSFDSARQIAAAAWERREQLALPAPAQAEEHMKQLRAAEEAEAEHIAQEWYPETQAPPEAFVDAEVLSEEEAAEEEELKRLEELCRQTLAFADWAQDRINRQIAKSGNDIPGLAEKLKAEMPKQWQQAEEFFAASEPAEEETKQEDAPEQGDLL